MLTVIRQNCQGDGNRVNPEIAKIAGMSFLANHTTGDLVCAEQNAIVDALIEAKRPVRTIDVDSLDE